MEITKPKNIHIGKKYIVELAEIAAGIKAIKESRRFTVILNLTRICF